MVSLRGCGAVRATTICLLLLASPSLLLFAAFQAQSPTLQSGSSSNPLSLPLNPEPHVGDLDAMVKRHEIRVLVVFSRSGFFYNAARPEGIYYEAFSEFQRFANQHLKTGLLNIEVTFLPVSIDALGKALLEGKGDVIGFPVVVTSNREKEVLFTTPIDPNQKEVLVTGPRSSPIAGIEELSGKQVYVNPITVYYDNLQQLSNRFKAEGKAPIELKQVDRSLTDEDILEMVSAGLIPATVTLDVRARFWAKVFPQLNVHPNIALKADGPIAFATRKDSPELLRLLNEFIEDRKVGTSFGNTLVRRYLQNTGWVKNATATEEMKKFRLYVRYFKKYAAQYDFDYLMLVAQGYQESRLEQSVRSPEGAIGIMQVVPKYAAAPPISISNVEEADDNIHAGAKILRNIEDQ